MVTVQIQLPRLEVAIYDIYSGPGGQLEASEVLSLTTYINVLVSGDFNAHHPILQFVSRPNPSGRYLVAVLEDLSKVVLLINGEPTHVRGVRVDLTLVSRDLATGASWWVHPTLTTDHYILSTILRVGLPPLPLPPPRCNVKKAVWVKFQDTLSH